MKTVLIGTGNVAYHLAKAFTKAGIKIDQVFGRNENDLNQISTEFEIPASTDTLMDADFYLIAVKDDAVAEVSKLINKESCLVAHTSGSLAKEILTGNYRKASFYPLQTFSKTKDLVYSEIPFFLEAENESDFSSMLDLAQKISKKVIQSDFQDRKHMHLTAVFACNFTNHLFTKAKEISDSRDIPFYYFFPLIDETVKKIREIEPELAQTGPAVRGDQKVLNAHRELIKDKNTAEIYDVMNRSILEMYKK